MAALKEMPFGRYYGSVDATPLFVLLAGAYYERTGDRLRRVALAERRGRARAGSTATATATATASSSTTRRSPDGLVHQGWKDSDDAVFHADGSPAHGPIALCEVQGYVYAARRAGARRWPRRWACASCAATASSARPKSLRERFEHAFWCEELSTYALALDGDKRPCRVRTSNAGPVPVHRHRPARAWPAGARHAARRRVLLRLGRPDARVERRALQPDGLPQRLGLAARQRAGRLGPRPLRPDAGAALRDLGPACSRPAYTSTCTGCRSCSAASRRPRRGAGPVSGGLRPAGLGGRLGLLLLQAMPRARGGWPPRSRWY